MKRIIFALLASTALALCSCAANNSVPAAATANPSPAVTANVATIAELEKIVIGLEKKTWELAKGKQAEEYGRLLVPGFRGIYWGATKDAQEATNDLAQLEVKQYVLSDIKVNFPVKDTAIIIYKLTGMSAYQGKEFKDPQNCSAVWVNIGGEWRQALYTESPAAPAK